MKFAAGLFLAFALIGLAGCTGRPPEPVFVYQKNTERIHQVPYGTHTAPINPIAAELVDNFGTPNKLVVWEIFPLDYGQAEPEAVDPARREAGWRIKEGRNLYMVHCLHCHGVSGDGDGPTAEFLNPLPRDFRNGVFKFTSTETGIKPTRSDLKRTLENGIPATAMPSFVLLGDETLDALVEYVRFLSMRGEYERRLFTALRDVAEDQKVIARAAELEKAERKPGETPLQAAEREIIEELEKADKVEDDDPNPLIQAAREVAEAWERAETAEMVVQPREATVLPGAKLFSAVEPRPKLSENPAPTGRVKLGPQTGEYWQVKSDKDEDLGYLHMTHIEARTGIDEHGRPTPKSLARGRELYLSEDLACWKCHGLSGRGDGPNNETYWVVTGSKPEVKYTQIGLHDDWQKLITPRNLTRPVYRGGRRPIDLYRRLRAGIKGTPMAGFSDAKYKQQPVTDSDLWDIINYVTSLPFEASPKAAAPAKLATK